MKGILTIVLFVLPGIALRAQNGNFRWAKQMGGISSNGSGSSITSDRQGDIYITGSFGGTIDFDPGPGIFNLTSFGKQNIFISKLDSEGNFLWAKQMGKTGHAAGASITLDSLGNIYTTGFFDATVDFDPGPGIFELNSFGGDGDIFISKLDASGNFVWAKKMGGIYGDQGFSIALDKSGSIYLTGEAQGLVDFDPGPSAHELTSWGHFVAKLDASGDFVWAKIMRATGFSTGRTIALDKTGNIYTTGWFGGQVDFDPGPADFTMDASGIRNFVLKLDPGGNFVWAKKMGGSFSWETSSMALDPSGNVLVTGTFESTEDFDPGSGVVNLVPVGGIDMFVSKLDKDGNLLWAKQLGGTEWEGGNSIATDANGNNYLTGWFGGTVDFDPGTGIQNLTSIDSRDIFISALDAGGNFLWAKQLGGPGPRPITNTFPLSGNSISLDASGNIFTTGSFDFTVDFDPNAGTFNLSSVGSTDVFVHKLGKCIQNAGAPVIASVCDMFTWNGQTYTTSGLFTQTLINAAGCDSIVTLELTIKPKAISLVDTTICQGQEYAGYTSSGTYMDTLIAANGCDSMITLILTVLRSPKPDLGIDKHLCPGDSLVLSPGQYDSYLWQDSSNQSSFIVKQPGIFTVTVTDACGTGTDEIRITESACDIWFPSAFTPNNDGKNDLFTVLGAVNLQEYHLKVYDRWGQSIFETNDYTKGWKGEKNGKLQSAGVYVWHCRLRKEDSSQTIFFKGTVILIR